MAGKSKKTKKVKVESKPKPFEEWFRAHRILHGGKEVVEILTAYKKVYKLIAWDLVPVANQFLLVVELEPK